MKTLFQPAPDSAAQVARMSWWLGWRITRLWVRAARAGISILNRVGIAVSLAGADGDEKATRKHWRLVANPPRYRRWRRGVDRERAYER